MPRTISRTLFVVLLTWVASAVLACATQQPVAVANPPKAPAPAPKAKSMIDQLQGQWMAGDEERFEGYVTFKGNQVTGEPLVADPDETFLLGLNETLSDNHLVFSGAFAGENVSLHVIMSSPDEIQLWRGEKKQLLRAVRVVDAQQQLQGVWDFCSLSRKFPKRMVITNNSISMVSAGGGKDDGVFYGLASNGDAYSLAYMVGTSRKANRMELISIDQNIFIASLTGEDVFAVVHRAGKQPSWATCQEFKNTVKPKKYIVPGGGGPAGPPG